MIYDSLDGSFPVHTTGTTPRGLFRRLRGFAYPEHSAVVALLL